MSKLYTDVWKDTLQNLSGKQVEGNFQELADLLTAFNDLYLCKVTFSTTPEGATVVVTTTDGTEIGKNADGTFHLKEGTYKYSVSAVDYTAKTNQTLTITNSDEQTGTKTESVSLTRVNAVVGFDVKDSSTSAAIDGATVKVYDSEAHEVAADSEGKYHIPAGSYTYDVTATGYTSQTSQSLTVSSGDVTTGTKTVTVSLVAAAE